MEIRRQTRPLRFVVQDIYTVDGREIVVGRVESGKLCKGDELVFYPSGSRGRVQQIRRFEGELEEAEEGDSVGLVTTCRAVRGEVGGLVDSAPVVTTRFLGEAVLLDGRLSTGDTLELRCGTRRVRCCIREFCQKIDSETGEVLMERPDHIGEHEAATIVFDTEPLVVERFCEIPELGRFVLSRGKNIGAGIVLEVRY